MASCRTPSSASRSPSKGLQRSAERALTATFGLVSLATVCLVSGFLANDFRLDYVYHYSSSTQPLPYKIGALWGGQAGSLLLWALMLVAMGALTVRTNRDKNRALMPVATAVISTVALFHGTCTINSLSHVFGTAPYETGDTSKNNPLLALITLGEGWHNNHHYYQGSVRQGFRWWQVDITYYVLKVMSWFRIVWDLHPVPEHVVAAGSRRR